MQSTHSIKHCVPSMMQLNYLISHSLLGMWESLQSAFVKYLLCRYNIFLWTQKQSDKLLDHLMNPEAHYNAKLKRSVCPCVAEPAVDSIYCCSLWGRVFAAVCSALSLNTHHTGHGQPDISNPLLSIPKALRRGPILTYGCPFTAGNKFNSEPFQKLSCLSEPGYACKKNRLN